MTPILLVSLSMTIRCTFGKMGMDETETLALIGGGHEFGKCHGACDSPPCGEGDIKGIGVNTFTSGYEGAWNTDPTTWTIQYFANLFDYDWELVTGPGGERQWASVKKWFGRCARRHYDAYE